LEGLEILPAISGKV